ncbi:MAG: hypothetical protein JWQ74_3546 [Marmoricola sp.]|nr:hypothetical protein [Marmoricola sp.]
MTAAILLRSALKLISRQENWCTHYMARDRHQDEVRPDSEAARRWSLDGALLRCADLGTKNGQGDYHQAVQYLRSMAKWKSLAEINDGRSHREIIEMLDRAAAGLSVAERIAA